MSNSSGNLLDTIATSQAQKEVTANAAFDALSVSAFGGRRASTTSALTWGFYGGTCHKADGSIAQVAHGTVSLTGSTTNYVEFDQSAGSIGVNASGWTAGKRRLYQIVTGSATVTSYTDYRDALAQLGSLTATGNIGFEAGAGGTVTQATSKSTGVTLNKSCGAITLNNAALAAATSVGFTLSNSAIAATDVIVANIKSGATADSYTLTVDAVAAGSCRISVRNVSAGSLGEALVLNFAVLKAVAA